MAREHGFEFSEETPVYVISVAAELSGLHPQTLRQYDRLGLVSPGRAPGRGRRYSARDVHRLREVARMSQDEGINLAGIKRILELVNANDALVARVEQLEGDLAFTLAALRERQSEPSSGVYRRVNLPVAVAPPAGTSVVVWRPLDHNLPPERNPVDRPVDRSRPR